MGRKSKKSKNGMNNLRSRAEVICGRSLLNLGAGSASIAISPAVFARVAAIADVFQYYRFTRLRVRAVPTASFNAVVGYAPGTIDNPPNTTSAIIELPYAMFHGSAKTTDTILDIPRSELLNDSLIKWYKTIVGTPAAEFEIQGNLYYTITGGGTLVFDYTVEFQSWNLAGNTPKVPGPPVSGLMNEKSDDSKSGSSDDVLIVRGVTYRKSQGVPSPLAATYA